MGPIYVLTYNNQMHSTCRSPYRTVPLLPFLYLIRHERREEEKCNICYLLSRLCYDSYLRDFSFLDFVAALLFVIHFSDWIPTRKYSLFLLLLLFHLVFVYSIV